MSKKQRHAQRRSSTFLEETGFTMETNLILSVFFASVTEPAVMTEILIEQTADSAEKKSCNSEDHRECLLGLRDAIEVLSGKWKVRLIGTLIFGGRRRFMDLLREVEGIGAKMLSKELQDLEEHQLVSRTVVQTRPITVEYEITPYGMLLRPLILEIAQWGVNHRRKIMREEQVPA